jgi:hypothetical protein
LRTTQRIPPDPAEDEAVVVPGAADARPLRGQQRPEAGPLGVGQLRERRGGPAGGGAGVPLGSLAGAPRGVAAVGAGLVGAAPPRPAQAVRPARAALSQGQQEAAHLRHRERDQAGIRAPPFWAASPRLAARRVTAR